MLIKKDVKLVIKYISFLSTPAFSVNFNSNYHMWVRRLQVHTITHPIQFLLIE